jgi:small subunit ribosomal protein S20
MPHTVSAAKRLRQNEQRRLRNKSRSTELKSISKDLLRALNDGKPEEAKNLYRELSSRLDQAASLKVIHKNHAARTKARMAKRLAAPPPTPTQKSAAKA